MNNEHKQIIVEMSKSKILELTNKLNVELAKVHLFSIDFELNDIFNNCFNKMEN